MPPGRASRARARARRAQALRRHRVGRRRGCSTGSWPRSTPATSRRCSALFAPDATWTADGGGKTAAAPQPDRRRRSHREAGHRPAREVLGGRSHASSSTTVNGETGLCVPRRRPPGRRRCRSPPTASASSPSTPSSIRTSSADAVTPRGSSVLVVEHRGERRMNPRIDLTKHLGSGLGRAMLALSAEVGVAHRPRPVRAGEDSRVADERLRLLHRHAHQGRACWPARPSSASTH